MTCGPESLLTEELTLQIRKLVLEGMKYVDIQETLGILAGTWDKWYYEDYRDFRKNIISWKKERLIKKAETQVELLSLSEDERVSLDASKFILETLGKEEYSKRVESTGANGQPIAHQITGMQIIKDNGNNIQDQESKTTGSI